ncbi:hypothetical protein KI387_007589, partial [Taxus chinensis]
GKSSWNERGIGSASRGMRITPAPPPHWHLDPSKKRVIGYDSSLSERVVMSSSGKLKL